MLPHRKQGRSSHSEGNQKKIHLCHSGDALPTSWQSDTPDTPFRSGPLSPLGTALALRTRAAQLVGRSCGTLHFVQGLTNVDTATPVKRTRKSMSRRTGQIGHIERSGRWWVARWWMDIKGQDKRVLKRAKICPTSGTGSLTKSERQRRCREIIAASGADTEKHFNQVVVLQQFCVTFSQQAEKWFSEAETRKRKPVASSTIQTWRGCLDKWLKPNLGNIPLSDVNNGVVKHLVALMSDGGLSPKSITNYVQILKAVVASAVNQEGEELYPRRWKPEFIDLPVVVKSKQNTPSFSTDVMSGLAKWRFRQPQMLFILCGASGMRIGEALGLDIEKHISPDFRTVTIEQKVRHCKVEYRVKTDSAKRKVDLHPSVATLLQEFVGERRTGFLFQSRNGKPLSSSNILRRHLHPALKELGYLNQITGTCKAGSHAFRRFRNTFLKNHSSCPRGLYKYWLGHAATEMSDLYDKVRHDVGFRREWAERCGIGFDLHPLVVPMIPKIEVRGGATGGA
jgi:integrase